MNKTINAAVGTLAEGAMQGLGAAVSRRLSTVAAGAVEAVSGTKLGEKAKAVLAVPVSVGGLAGALITGNAPLVRTAAWGVVESTKRALDKTIGGAP